MRIAIIGQSNFASDVLEIILGLPEKPVVVGVFTIPDKGNREDVLCNQSCLQLVLGLIIFKVLTFSYSNNR